MTTVLRIATAALAAGLTAGAARELARPGGPLAAAARRYRAWIDAHLRALFSPLDARGYALRHLGGALALGGAAGALAGALPGVTAAGVAAAYGFAWPGREHARRRARLEAHIDPALRSMAQTLRATSDIVEALDSVARLGDPPLSQEIDLAVRQHRLGMPLDEALRGIADRTGSAVFDTAVTAISIGRASGGNLPAILEEVAASLRERMRLDAFVAARTAEGRAQAWVMGLLPIGMAAFVHFSDPTWLAPLFHDPIGWIVLAAIAVCEVSGVLLVRRLSTVDA